MSYADFHLGKPAPQGHQEFSFVMATTVDDLSYTPSEEERSRDAAQFVATGRKSWKTLKGKGEAVWPPLLEAALLEALEKYSPDTGNSKGDKTMGRFPMRNRFISDYIFETTGKRRTPKQVGSRLQQLRDTCKKEHILALISHRHTPEYSTVDSHSNYTASPSPRPESRPPPSISHVYVQISLQGEMWPSPTPSINLISNDTAHAQIIQLSPLSQRSSHYNDNFPNILPFLSSDVEFHSQYALEQESTFLVYTSNRHAPIHVEKVPLVCLSSSIQRSGWLYRASLVSEFWATLCSSEDLSQFTIIQQLTPANAGAISSLNSVDRCSPSHQIISVIYKFDARVSASRRPSLVTPLTYQNATPNTQPVPSVSTEMSHSGLPGVTPPYTWQIDAGNDLNSDYYQPLAGRSRHADPNVHYVGQAATGMVAYNAYQQQQSCSPPELHVKEGQEIWGRANIHAPVPLQHSHQLDNFYYA